jgi:phosphomannomutase
MDYKNIYIDFLKKWIKVDRPLTVVFDVSNGPVGMIIKDLFVGTKVNVILINDEIDPDFKARGPNPLLDGATIDCKRAILENGADLGIMFDADGDRAFFLDDKGEMIPACFVVGLLFKEFTPPYVMDELVYQSVRLLNIVPDKDILPNRIGAYFIKESLRNNNASFGAEYSGHYYFKDFFNCDSGIFTSIMFLNTLSRLDQKISDWVKQFGEHKIVTKEIKIGDKDMKKLYEDLEEKYKDQAESLDKRDGITFVFSDFWINVRSSNTEPIMRIVGGGGGGMDQMIAEIESLIL